MTTPYSIEQEDEFTLIRFSRAPGVDDIKAVLDELASSQRYHLRLYDMRDVVIDFQQRDLREIADHGKTLFFKPSRAAFVANDDLTYAVMRVLEVYREVQPQFSLARVFRDMPAAREWLAEEQKVLQAITRDEQARD